MSVAQRFKRIRRDVGLRNWALIRMRRLAELQRRRGELVWPEQFVFIITYGRTGSTLLQKVLNTMPGVYMAGENHGIIEGLQRAWRDALTLRHIFGQGHQSSDDPWHGAMVADPDAFGQGIAEVFVRTILKPPRGARIIGFKEVRYLTPDLGDQLEFMAQVFAPALFLINRRAPDDVSRSALWRDRDPAALAGDIAQFEAATAAFAAARPGQCLTLDYEHWTTDPEALRSLYARLGQTFDAAAVADLLSIRLTHCQ